MSNQAVTEATEVMNKYFTATQGVIDNMSDGARKQVKDMAEAVAMAVDEAPKDVYGFVNWYVHRPNVGGYVSRGQNGGFVKGVRPVKKVKSPKVESVSSEVDVSTLEENDT